MLFISLFMPSGPESRYNLCAMYDASDPAPILHEDGEELPSNPDDIHKYRLLVSTLQTPKHEPGLGAADEQ